MDVGFFEICLILVVALLVLGPNRLSNVAKMLGVMVSKSRKLWREVKDEVTQRENRE